MDKSLTYSEWGKLYQDQLYGDKYITPLAAKIIDTPEFQRLSRIKELGFTDYVYKGAVHTRFAHSVGTYFMTKRIMRKIAQNHHRLGFKHPADDLPNFFSLYPNNSYNEIEWEKDKENKEFLISNQSKWRGLMEIISIAALLHDITHVPYGHTLEDEFTGIYKRHDNLGGARLYTILFDNESSINRILKTYNIWEKDKIDQNHLSSFEIIELIYLILSWKEQISPPCGFKILLDKEIKKSTSLINELVNNQNSNAKILAELELSKRHLKRLKKLKKIFMKFTKENNIIFQPFMSDIVGNTICSDLLDYLPRDRKNLGMEYSLHTRIQRYLTIRPGTLYKYEGNRLSILVTRRYRGGQRRDVATAVLDIMRERYELVERVLYHHKKAAVSSMLAKLAEITFEHKPSDDEDIYPAPWQNSDLEPTHMMHFDDISFIDYLGKKEIDEKLTPLQKKLYNAIRFNREKVYKTLLFIDNDVIESSRFSFDYIIQSLRKDEAGNPSNKSRNELEEKIAESANVKYGDIIIYCPSDTMQAKEVDARLEIEDDNVTPLRCQSEKFTYNADIKVLESYYHNLWQTYIFVSPEVFESKKKCKIIVDYIRKEYEFSKMVLYSKVRGHKLDLENKVSPHQAVYFTSQFLGKGSFSKVYKDIPQQVIASFLHLVSDDLEYLRIINYYDDNSKLKEKNEEITYKFNRDIEYRLRQLMDASVLTVEKNKIKTNKIKSKFESCITSLLSGNFEPIFAEAATEKHTDRDYTSSFEEYRSSLLSHYGLSQQTEVNFKNS